jgi:hypothetical protein
VIFQFGTYQHRINSAGLQVDRQPILDHRQEAYLVTERWTVDFREINTGQSSADLDAQIAALEEAYSQTAAIAQLLHDDGTPTVHNLQASNTLGGIRVVKPPSYMRFQNGEYVSYRTGNLILEATIKLTEDVDRVIEHTWSLDMDGGGPVDAHLQPNVGPAVKQRVRTMEKFTATYSGRIVHLGTYGPIPPTIWPQAQIRRVKPRIESPKLIVGTAYGFPTNYTYQYESAVPLTGIPAIF